MIGEAFGTSGLFKTFRIRYEIKLTANSCIALCSSRNASGTFQSRYQLHRKRESLHDVIGCGAPRIRWHWRRHSDCRTTAHRMATDRKLDQSRDDLCGGAVRNTDWRRFETEPKGNEITNAVR